MEQCFSTRRNSAQYYEHFLQQQTLVDEYIFWGVVNATVSPSRVTIFFRALSISSFVASQVVAGLQRVLQKLSKQQGTEES
jgi:hypothetical protein